MQTSVVDQEKGKSKKYTIVDTLSTITLYNDVNYAILPRVIKIRRIQIKYRKSQ